MQLSEIADRLYALPPEEFTKARDAAVREARAGGDRELAGQVKQLRRPPVSAWAVNMLARERGAALEDLLGLGAELRDAQQALAGDDLRALSRHRHRVIASLTDEARTLVAQTGHPLADAASREVGATLEAGLVDESAAAAVRSGRLMRPLTSTGLEAVELTGAVAAPDQVAAVPRRPSGPARKARREPADRKARLAAIRKDAQQAHREATRTERELAAAEAAFGAARDAADDASARVAELTEALRQAKADHSAADSDRRRAERAQDDAAKARQSAGRAAEKADAALVRLQG